MPLIRYPGSKAKLVDAIVSNFPPEMRMPLWMDAGGWEYREPFFGSGAIGFAILDMLPDRCSAWINDKDYWLICMWKAVQQSPKELCEKIDVFEPGADKFYEYKRGDGGRNIDPVEAGFRKLALHQMSYSGIGAMAGGPLGGRDQDNAKYPVDCRWNPEVLQQTVWELHELLTKRRVKITCWDFSAMFDGCRTAYIYLDPPYVEKGEELYKYAFTLNDHRRLARLLRASAASWSVSYDDHPLVRELYAGYRVIPIDVRYSVAVETEKRRKNQEVLILSAA